MKSKHFEKNDNYTSFLTEPSYQQTATTFDNTMNREKAMKPFMKVGEGAPFWKYNVKDEVITAPIKTYQFSRNAQAGHTWTDKFEQKQHEFKCGRIARRLEALKKKYEDLHAHD